MVALAAGTDSASTDSAGVTSVTSAAGAYQTDRFGQALLIDVEERHVVTGARKHDGGGAADSIGGGRDESDRSGHDLSLPKTRQGRG